MKKVFLLTSLFLALLTISCNKNTLDRSIEIPVLAAMSTFSVDGENNGGNITCEEVSSTVDYGFDYSSGRLNSEDFPTGGTTGPITWKTDGKYVCWTSTVRSLL